MLIISTLLIGGSAAALKEKTNLIYTILQRLIKIIMPYFNLLFIKFCISSLQKINLPATNI